MVSTRAQSLKNGYYTLGYILIAVIFISLIFRNRETL